MEPKKKKKEKRKKGVKLKRERKKKGFTKENKNGLSPCGCDEYKMSLRVFWSNQKEGSRCVGTTRRTIARP